MLYDSTPFKQHVKDMKIMAQFLVPYSPPNAPDDDDITFFKQREIVADGYTLAVQLSRIEHKDHDAYLDVVSLTGKYMPYLPMPLLCKVAEGFLGNKELTFTEVTQNGRKYYSWMVLYNLNGTPISNDFIGEGVVETYNGLKFIRCQNQHTI